MGLREPLILIQPDFNFFTHAKAGNPGPQGRSGRPPVQARGKLWTPASAGVTRGKGRNQR